MLSVAICDDEPLVRKEIAELTAAYFARADIDGHLTEFPDGETLFSVIFLTPAVMVVPILLAVIFNAQWVMIPLYFTYLPSNFMSMLNPNYMADGWEIVLCMIGAPLCILLATAVGALFSYDTAE